MRTYISAKYYFIISWISLAICSIFCLIGLAVLIFGGLFRDGHLSLEFLLPMAFGLLFYTSIVSRTIFVEDNKIIVKGIFNTRIFDPSNFDEVRKTWFGKSRNYLIYFKDGSSFYFVPRMYYGDTFSFKRFWNKSIMEEVQDIVDRAR